MKVLKWIDDHFEEALISIIICVISVLMMAQIILRSFFSASLSWSDETCRYLFIWAAGLGISYATKNEAHLRMDILPNLFKKLEKPLIVVCDIAVIAVSVYLMGPGLDPCAYVSGVCIHVGGTGPVHHKNPGAVYQNAPAPVFACGE